MSLRQLNVRAHMRQLRECSPVLICIEVTVGGHFRASLASLPTGPDSRRVKLVRTSCTALIDKRGRLHESVALLLKILLLEVDCIFLEHFQAALLGDGGWSFARPRAFTIRSGRDGALVIRMVRADDGAIDESCGRFLRQHAGFIRCRLLILRAEHLGDRLLPLQRLDRLFSIKATVKFLAKFERGRRLVVRAGLGPLFLRRIILILQLRLRSIMRLGRAQTCIALVA